MAIELVRSKGDLATSEPNAVDDAPDASQAHPPIGRNGRPPIFSR